MIYGRRISYLISPLEVKEGVTGVPKQKVKFQIMNLPSKLWVSIKVSKSSRFCPNHALEKWCFCCQV
jgi:hypothetical protein